MQERREREVDPHTALDHEDEQQRQRDRLERHQQHEDDEHDREDADERVVRAEGVGKVLVLGRLADEIGLVVVFADGALDDRQVIVGLLALDREVEIEDHARVMLGMQLLFAVDEAVIHLLEVVHGLSIDLRAVDVALFIQELEHVDERHGAVVNIAQIHELAEGLRIIIVCRAVGRVERARHADVDIRELGELARRERIGDHVAVLGLLARERLNVIDALELVEIVEQARLALKVREREDEHDLVRLAEGGVDLLLGDLIVVLLNGVERAVAEHVRALAAQQEARNNDDQKDRRHDITAADGKAAERVDARQELAVVRLVDPRAHVHDERRHQEKHRQHQKQDRLDEHKAHVLADLNLHERERKQARDRRQARGRDLRNGQRQRTDGRLTGREKLALLRVVVAHDDRVVDAETELQHRRDGVGDKRDLMEPVVRALVDPDGHAKGDDEHRDLRVSTAREQEHHEDRAHEDDEHDAHLMLEDLAGRVADLGCDIGIIAAERRADVLHALNADLIELLAVKRDLKERRGTIIMVCVLFKFHVLDAVHTAQHLGKLLRLRERHVGHHDLRIPVSNELTVHDLQPLARLRGVRQIIGQLIVDVRLARREDRQHARHGKQHHKQPPFVHNERRQTLHKRLLHTPAPHRTALPPGIPLRARSKPVTQKVKKQ